MGGHWLSAAILGAFVAGGAVAEGEAIPTVTGVSFAERGGGLRLVFEVAPEPPFAVFMLTDPDRLVIDLPALDWRVGALPEIPYVAELRHGLARPGRARLVLELAEPMGVRRAFSEPSGDAGSARLVVELAPVTRAAFDARAGAPEGARWPGSAEVALADTGEGVVAVDPGHGGFDPGARVGRLVEKALVLDFARLLADEIATRPGFRAFLTRDEDVFVPLAERVARARDAGAHLLISVHADVLAQGRARGVAAYTLSGEGTDEAANALAARESRANVLTGADLGGEAEDVTRLLVELAQRGTLAESAKLANAVLESVATHSEVLRTRPLREASLRVLKAPDVPAILLELGFMDDPADRKRLADPVWMARTARRVADGIAAWRDAASPGFVAPR